MNEVALKEVKTVKSTGIVRKVDKLGRVVIPMELRKVLNISSKDAIEIFSENNMLILRKYEPSCIFCGNATNVTTYKGVNICPECIMRMQKHIKKNVV